MSQRQCLPIDDEESSTDSEFNFDLGQLSALEYLKKVRSERKKLPQIVTKEIPPEYRNFNASNSEFEVTTTHKCEQTKEWREIQREKFKEIQNRISDLRTNESVQHKILDALPLDIYDEEALVKYCKEKEPGLSLMLALDQSQLEFIIEALAVFFSENIESTDDHNFTFLSEFSWITKWIYSSLACLYTPLDPEIHNSIRMIAKASIQLITQTKSSNKDSQESLSLYLLPYDLLITIIAQNFQQYDLLSL